MDSLVKVVGFQIEKFTMSDIVSEVITGLGTSGGGMLFALVVLAGAYFLFKKTFTAFLQSNFNQTNFITSIERRQMELETRLSKIEEEIKDNLK